MNLKIEFIDILDKISSVILVFSIVAYDKIKVASIPNEEITFLFTR